MKKLDENPDLLEAFAKRSLDDPDFFAAEQKGDLNKLDELTKVSKLTPIIVRLLYQKTTLRRRNKGFVNHLNLRSPYF